MKIISISKKKFNELKKLELSREVLNVESTLYDFDYKGEKKVIKKLYNLNGYTFANKLYTIEMLDNNKKYLPSSFWIPDYLCSLDGNIIGFTVPKIDGINFSTILNCKTIDNKEKIYYLKKIGEILNQLQSIRKYTPLKDLYINDLHESNFIVDNNNKELKVIDLDSCKIGANKPFQARFLTPNSIIDGVEKYKLNLDDHSDGYIIANEDSDLFCYCMIILNYLYGNSVYNMDISSFYEYLNYLEYIGIHKDLLNVFNKLIVNCSNENPLYYLDSLDDIQLCRAKKNVYEQIKHK